MTVQNLFYRMPRIEVLPVQKVIKCSRTEKLFRVYSSCTYTNKLRGGRLWKRQFSKMYSSSEVEKSPYNTWGGRHWVSAEFQPCATKGTTIKCSHKSAKNTSMSVIVFVHVGGATHRNRRGHGFNSRYVDSTKNPSSSFFPFFLFSFPLFRLGQYFFFLFF